MSGITKDTIENVPKLRARRGLYHGERVFLQGYHTIGDGGESGVWWDSRSVDDDNGFTVFSVGTLEGRWRREKVMLTPAHAGAIDRHIDSSFDSREALQRFFNVVLGSKIKQSAKAIGNFAIGGQLIIERSALHYATLYLEFDLFLRSLGGFESDKAMVVWRNTPNLVCVGRFDIQAGTSFYNRLHRHALEIKSVTRASLPDVGTSNSKREGIFIRDGGNLVRSDYIGSAQCGHSSKRNVVSFTQNGVANSVHQRTAVQLNALPDQIEATDMALHNGNPYEVMAVDPITNTVELYPWVHDLADSDAIQFMIGGGIRMEGGDSSIWNIGHIDVSDCPIGMKNRSLYPPNINVFHYSRGNTDAKGEGFNAGVGMLLGTAPVGSSEGGNVQNFYCEGTADLQLVEATITQTSFALGSMSAHPQGLKAIRKLTRNDGQSRTKGILHGNIQNHDGHFYGDGGGYVDGGSSPNRTISLRQTGVCFYTQARSAPTEITLRYDDSIHRLFGADTIFALARGKNGQSAGDVTFSADQGWRVNGSASDTFTMLPKQVLFICTAEISEQNWIVTRLDSV